jgi:thymidine phosphorylase
VRVEDRIDPAVGVSALVKIGDTVERGQPLMVMHANRDNKLEEALALANGAVCIGDRPTTPLPLIAEIIQPQSR